MAKNASDSAQGRWRPAAEAQRVAPASHRSFIMPSLFQIVVHTPLWVWPILIFVLALGVYGLRPRIINPWRLVPLPMVGLAMSVAGMAQSAEPALAAAGWSMGLLAALPLGYTIGRQRDARRLPDGRLELAGGWFMLLFGLAIFFTRYALGFMFAVMPWLRGQVLWIAASGGVGGVIAGIGLGWLAGLLLRDRLSPMVR
jgi:hypothetical protein